MFSAVVVKVASRIIAPSEGPAMKQFKSCLQRGATVLSLAFLLCLPARAVSERHLVWKSSEGSKFAEAVELRKNDAKSTHVRYLVLTPGGHRAVLTDSFILEQSKATAKLRDEETGWWATVEITSELGDLGPLEEFDISKLIGRLEAENPTEIILLRTSDGFKAELQHKNYEGGDHARKLAESLEKEGALQEVSPSLRAEIGFLKALADQGHLNHAATARFLLETLSFSMVREDAKGGESVEWEAGSSLPWSTDDPKASSRTLKERFRSIDRTDPWKDEDAKDR
jgi:hypothetical protein